MSQGLRPEDLYGTWRLVSAKTIDKDGKQLPSQWGPEPAGRLVLMRSGRMMAVLCDGRAQIPAGVTRSYSSYIGSYRIDGDTLITRVDGAADASRIGGDQVRKLARSGEFLVLMPPREANGEQRELFWKYDGTE